MRLYHFTSFHHYPKIEAAGVLNVTESNIGSPREDWPPFGEHVAPDVVWLTSSSIPDPKATGLTGSSVDKTAVRFTVEVPDAEHWPGWSEAQGINPNWRRALGTGDAQDEWWVVTRAVPRAEWVDVDFVKKVQRRSLRLPGL